MFRRARPGAIGQDPAKVARYARYLEFAYQQASNAVEKIVQTIGVDGQGEPLSDVFVVFRSRHGPVPHGGEACDHPLECGHQRPGTGASSQVTIRTIGTGGRTSTSISTGARAVGTWNRAAFQESRQQNRDSSPRTLWIRIRIQPVSRPALHPCLDSPRRLRRRAGILHRRQHRSGHGDVLALMDAGYNFDGAQSPLVHPSGRLAPTPPGNPFSVPNFYGAHGHDSELSSMSAIFYAAGPNVKQGSKLRQVRNIDVAPTLLEHPGLLPQCPQSTGAH